MIGSIRPNHEWIEKKKSNMKFIVHKANQNTVGVSSLYLYVKDWLSDVS